MRPGLIHEGLQHPIGQGCFFSGRITRQGTRTASRPFHYVYDCGSENGYALNREIDAFVSSLGGSPIDVLFVSHLDKDHVGGLDRLLAVADVDTAVLPYLSPIDRLILAARALTDDGGDGPSGTGIQLWGDPAVWLGARGVRRVIMIRGSEKGGEGPSAIMPEAPLEPDQDEEFSLEEERIGLVLPSAATREVRNTRVDPAEYPDVHSLPHEYALPLQGIHGGVNWTFVTFVHPEAERASRFRERVHEEFGIPDTVDARWLRSVLRDAGRREALKRCYTEIRADHNLVSMSLYSGPITLNEQVQAETYAGFGRPGAGTYSSGPCGWLATGDANLAAGTRRSAFTRHFERLFPHTLLMTLPHHGSRLNFHEELLEQPVALFLASAGVHNRFGHPSGEVIGALRSAGKGFLHITETSDSSVATLTRLWRG